MAETPAPSNGRGAPGRTDVTGVLAQWIVRGGLIYVGALSVIALIAVGLNPGGSAPIIALWKDVLTFTLPVLGAWVGTVLAFYFSKENFEAANRSVRDMVGQLSSVERLRSVSAKTAMVPRASIEELKLPVGRTEDQVSMKADVLPRLTGKVTRLPVFAADDTVKCVIHESTAHKFLLNSLLTDPNQKPTLQDLLDDAAAKKAVTALAFVPESASLADVQDAMMRVEGCQDVFVTAAGRRQEPVLGWITNAEIAKQVSV